MNTQEFNEETLVGLPLQEAAVVLSEQGLPDWDYDELSGEFRLRYWTPCPWTQHQVVISVAPKKRVFDQRKIHRAKAREVIGQPKPGQEIPDKRFKPPKHKKALDD